MNITDSHTVKNIMNSCNLCHRHCQVNRNNTVGYCGQTAEICAARAALHFWEEPCISGINGSGAVFFSGCSLRCVFCQNYKIAADSAPVIGSSGFSSSINASVSFRSGKNITIERLAEIFLELQEKGAHNINLVTPAHFIPQIASALILAKNQGLFLPIVYNTGSYETVEALKMLDGLIDIYLPDLKYYSPELSSRYSNAPDYFSCAGAAIKEMFRQAGEPQFSPIESSSDNSRSTSALNIEVSELSENGLMKKGVIVRHLLLPECLEDSKKVISYLYQTYGNSIFVSIMSQYTPMAHLASFVEDIPVSAENMTQASYSAKYPELSRRVSEAEYNELVDFAINLGMENAFIQDMDTADESFIPSFHAEGI